MEEESKANVSLESGELVSSPEKMPLDIPLPLDNTKSTDVSFPSQLNVIAKKTVLGIDNAKKRLKAFYIAKKVQEARSMDASVNTSILIHNELGKHKRSSESGSIPEKKKSKKGLTPHEKAKATMTEIEELKKTEALQQAMFLAHSQLLMYSYRRGESRERRDGSHRYRSNSHRYRSSSHRYSSDRDKRHSHKYSSKSYSSTRHKHDRNSDPKYHRENKHSRENRNEKCSSLSKRSRDNSELQDVAKKSNDQRYSSNSREQEIGGSCETYADRKDFKALHVEKNIKTTKLSNHAVVSDFQDMPLSINFENNMINPNIKLEVESSEHQKAKENVSDFRNTLLSTPKIKISAISVYDSETSSNELTLDNGIDNDTKSTKSNCIDEGDSATCTNVHANALDIKSVSGFSPSSLNTSSPKECESGSKNRNAPNNFIQRRIKDNMINNSQNSLYENISRHSYMNRKCTKTQPSLYYAENPVYSQFCRRLRNWYPHYRDCLAETHLSEVMTVSTVHIKPINTAAPNIVNQSDQYAIDMGDYDNTKNDISNRELVMNAEPPMNKTISKDLNTEYEEFMRAVTSDARSESAPQSLSKDKINDRKSEPLKLDLIDYIDDKSKKLKEHSTKSKIKVVSQRKGKRNLKLQKSKHSSSSDYSSSSESSSSGSESSSTNSSSDSSSSDSSSEYDSESSTKSEASDTQVRRKKHKTYLNNKSSTSNLKNIDSIMKKHHESQFVHQPLKIKQEKGIDPETGPEINISQVVIKQEPVDVNTENAMQDKPLEIDKAVQQVLVNEIEFSLNSFPESNEEVFSKGNQQDESINSDRNILSYCGETFQVLDWEESSQSVDNADGTSIINSPSSISFCNKLTLNSNKEETVSIADIKSNVCQSVDNISDIPLPKVAGDILLNDSFSTASELEEQVTPQKNAQFISFKLPSNSKCNFKMTCMTEEISETNVISKDLKEMVTDTSIQQNDTISIDRSNPTNIQCDELRQVSENVVLEESTIEKIEISRSRSRSSSAHELNVSDHSNHRSKSPRNHRSRDEKSYHSSSRSHTVHNKYSRLQSHKSPISSNNQKKYEKLTTHAGSLVTEKNKLHGDESPKQFNRLDVCSPTYRNNKDSKYRESPHYRPSSKNENLHHSYDEKRDRYRSRDRDHSHDRSKKSTRGEHYSRHNNYHIEKPKTTMQEYSDTQYDDSSKCSYSPKYYDLDNIPLPQQNDFSNIGASNITTVITTGEDYVTHDMDSMHPGQGDLYEENSFYQEQIQDQYRERILTEVSSPKRISLDDRINLVLGGQDNTSNSNSCDKDYQVDEQYGLSNYDNYGMDTNQYSAPVDQNMSYSTDFIETIYSYPTTNPIVNRRRVQSTNLVNVVLTDTPTVKQEPETRIEENSPPISSKVLSSDITKYVKNVVKLDGPLTMVSAESARTNSGILMQQIEDFIKQEEYQQRVKRELKCKDQLRKNKILLPKHNLDDDENSNQENMSNNTNYERNLSLINLNETESTSIKSCAQGILQSGISTVGYSVGNGPSKRVKFADGVLPGEGTSTSGGEEMTSPPPLSQLGKGKISKRKRKNILKKGKHRKNCDPRMGDVFADLPPPPAPEGDPPCFLLQPCDIADNAALGYTEIPEGLQQFAIFFNSALSQQSRNQCVQY